MAEVQNIFIALLNAPYNPNFNIGCTNSLSSRNPEELAQIYVDAGFLQCFLSFLQEQDYLQKNRENIHDFEAFITPFLQLEFSLMPYLHKHLQKIELIDIQSLIKKTKVIEKSLLAIIKNRKTSEQIIFSKIVLQKLSKLFSFEHAFQKTQKEKGLHSGLQMYHSFDSMDEIFGFHYQADHGMKTDLENTERLYEGAGVGVQSGYSTILTALQNIKTKDGSRIVDLGSGYGRIGIVIGLLRPDFQFTGFEYVPHRVKIANESAEKFCLSSHVKFYTQDLASEGFQVPEAEIYYLYDPFCQKTYDLVLNKLVKISEKNKICIITKGNARHQLKKILQDYGWAPPVELDSGNLCLFYS